MYCENCGKELRQGAKFCMNCGAPVPGGAAAAAAPPQNLSADPGMGMTGAAVAFAPAETPDAAPAMDTTEAAVSSAPSQALNAAPETGTEGTEKTPLWSEDGREAAGTPVADSIVLCPDGKYRWVYELSLLKNPTIFFLIWKIFFFIIVGIFGVTAVIDLISWGPEQLVGTLRVLLYFLIGMTVIVGISYLIYAAIMGWKYCVLFEMNEEGVNHKQMPKQAEKAQILGALAILAGAASHSVTSVGIGMNAQRTEMYSTFAKVRKVKIYPRRGLIKVNELLGHNQVYAEGEDFTFVRDYILAHCPKRR